MSNKNKKEQYLNDIEAPIVYADTNTEKDDKNESDVIINEVTNNFNAKKEAIPESVFTNYVKVKVVGRHHLAGIRMMSIVKIGKLILENNGLFAIITSQSTANLVKRVIRERSDLLNTTLPMEYREKKINIFENDLKTF